MASAFQTVVVGVTSAGILLSFTRFMQPLRAASEVGRTGSFFEHTEDRTPEQQPDGNVIDPPIPVRPIRPRG